MKGEDRKVSGWKIIEIEGSLYKINVDLRGEEMSIWGVDVKKC